MASIRTSALISDIAGKVGGVVFQRGANGLFVRALKIAKDRKTPAQIKARLNLAVYSNKWKSLTDEQRQSWTDAIQFFPYRNRLGETSFYTGFQLYMKTNLNLETAALV